MVDRAKYRDFVEAMLEKAKEKRESKPNTMDNVDMKKIEEITEKIKEGLPEKLKKKKSF